MASSRILMVKLIQCMTVLLLLCGKFFTQLQTSQYDPVSNISCSPHYHSKGPDEEEVLSKISTTFTREIDTSVSLCEISYSDSISGEPCDSQTIETSSQCKNKICRVEFEVPSSQCSNYTAINVTIQLPNYRSVPVKIDTVNRFITVLFDAATSTIVCTFLNQPKEYEKFCSVKYGPETHFDGCGYLPYGTDGGCSNSNSLSLEQDFKFGEGLKICFAVEASSGNDIVIVHGIHHTQSSPSKYATMVMRLRNILIIILIILLISSTIIISWRITSKIYASKYGRIIYVNDEDNRGELDLHIMKTAIDSADRENELTPIDLSTTFYKLWTVTVDSDAEDILLYEFARKHYPDYQPEDGFGYYKLMDKKIECVQPHRKVILMDKDELLPKFRILCSNLQQDPKRSQWESIYLQSRTLTKRLQPGSKFLYCARSKVLTAYFTLHDVTETCKQADFITEKNLAYQREWIRYGYFEFTKPEYILPHQSVIVMKNSGKLVAGPGVRHLIGAEDGSKLVEPPSNLSYHEGWKHVFIQSNGYNRELEAGTKYLFCATMERVNTYYLVYNVDKECTMEEIARSHIPGFKLEHGFGYREFKEESYFKPHRRKMLLHKDNTLYTGAGAQFVCTSGLYNEEIVSRKCKISPPNLEDKEWAHIFIQSYSKTRKLAPGTKFLYCEYKTLGN